MRIERGQLVVLLVLGGMTVAFMGGLWLPRHTEIGAKRRLVTQREAMVAQLREQNDQSVGNAIDDPEARAEAIKLLIPSRSDLGPLLERLAADAAEESLVVRQLQARAMISGRTFNRIPVTLECDGTYDALFRLVRRLEGYERIVHVDRIDLMGGSGGPAPSLRAVIELSTFCRTREEQSS